MRYSHLLPFLLLLLPSVSSAAQHRTSGLENEGDDFVPWVKLCSFVDVPSASASFTSTTRETKALHSNSPQALASIDLNGDGYADLISSHSAESAGVLTVYLRVPISRLAEPDASGYFEESGSFMLPVAPSFLGTGDFDADGKADLVAADYDGDTLYWLPGDGRGKLLDPISTSLPGAVRALVAADIDRRDGLNDVAIGLATPKGAELLVFESPRGAMFAEPEASVLPAVPMALAAGQLDTGYALDLAVAAGRQVVIVHGRDRRLTSTARSRARIPLPTISTIPLPFDTVSLTTGDFRRETGTAQEIAVLSRTGQIVVLGRRHKVEEDNENPSKAVWKSLWWEESALSLQHSVQSVVGQGLLSAVRLSSLKSDELAILDPASKELRVLLFPQTTLDGEEEKLQSVRQLARHSGGSPVALQALRLNGDALDDLVILRNGSIRPAVALTQPAHVFVVNTTADVPDCDLSDDICSDGDIDPSTQLCVPNGECGLSGAIQQANASPGADLIAFQLPGSTAIQRPYPSDPILEAVTVDGTTQGCSTPPCVELVNGFPSLQVYAGRTVIRGLAIRSEGIGVSLLGGGYNVIEKNFIGTDLSGTVVAGNGQGVIVESSNNVIGGTYSDAGNVIAGNLTGVEVRGPSAAWNLVQGNLIGTNTSGSEPLGQCGFGVELSDARSNTIGGSSAGSGNVISSCASGVGFGAKFLPGEYTAGNLIQGNLIGLDATGVRSIPNHFGIQAAATAHANLIGGIAPGAGNVISGNEYGVFINSAVDTLVQGNKIGTAGDSTVAVGNERGMVVRGSQSQIGGTLAAAGNVISGNSVGIFIVGDQYVTASANVVLGNLIGTDAAGTVPVPNGIGVYIQGSDGNRIGAPLLGGNLIANNTGTGVFVETGSGNTIEANSIHSNGLLGIDLSPQGVTPNDTGDVDIGANNLENFPSLVRASPTASGALVEGTLSTLPNTNVRIDLFVSSDCDATGYGEGESFVISHSLMTDSTGNSSFALEVPVRGSFSATSTGASGDTSEFSNCLSDGGTSSCGNGIIDPGESCDDWNTSPGDCCSSSCQAAPAGTFCDDGNICTPISLCDGVEDAAGQS